MTTSRFCKMHSNPERLTRFHSQRKQLSEATKLAINEKEDPHQIDDIKVGLIK